MLPDTDTIASLGGVLTNYAPVTDPTTDLDATADNTSRGNVAMMTRTVPRAIVAFRTGATTGAMVLQSHAAVWGNSLGVAPTLVRNSTGYYSVNWPSSVNDELGTAHTVNLRYAMPSAETAPFDVRAVVAAANIVNVRVYTDGSAAGVATDTATNILLVVY